MSSWRVLKQATELSSPHTVHYLVDGNVMISMFGDVKGNEPGGLLLLGEQLNVKERWETKAAGMNYNYDFSYQLRLGVMLFSEFWI